MESLKKQSSGMPVKKPLITLCENADPKIYYHYTSLEKMWLILENETIRATQACFSNDNEEIIKGIKRIKEICQEIFAGNPSMKDFHEQIIKENVDSYIVCFCKEDDKLSQWRAYCAEGGVSFGFAFDETNPRYYFKDESQEYQKSYPARIFPVYYYGEDESLNKHNPLIVNKNKLTEIIENKIDTIVEHTTKKDILLSLIPFIKQVGFYEEEEYRFLISNSVDISSRNKQFVFDNIINYSEDPKNKKPFINIKFGRNYPTEKDSKSKVADDFTVKQIRILGNDVHYNLWKDLITQLTTKNATYKKLFEQIKLIKEDCEQKCIIIGEAIDEKQKEIFQLLDGLNFSNKEKTPIWCEGHLPLRSITISPSINEEQVFNMLNHYCKHGKYWLKYVKINKSTIPYRST